MTKVLWMALLVLALAACGKGEAAWKKVKAGMTDDEVAEILGDPSKKTKPAETGSLGGGLKSGRARWDYGKKSYVEFERDKVVSVTYEGKALVAPSDRAESLGGGLIGD